MFSLHKDAEHHLHRLNQLLFDPARVRKGPWCQWCQSESLCHVTRLNCPEYSLTHQSRECQECRHCDGVSFCFQESWVRIWKLKKKLWFRIVQSCKFKLNLTYQCKTVIDVFFFHINLVLQTLNNIALRFISHT